MALCDPIEATQLEMCRYFPLNASLILLRIFCWNNQELESVETGPTSLSLQFARSHPEWLPCGETYITHRANERAVLSLLISHSDHGRCFSWSYVLVKINTPLMRERKNTHIHLHSRGRIKDTNCRYPYFAWSVMLHVSTRQTFLALIIFTWYHEANQVTVARPLCASLLKYLALYGRLWYFRRDKKYQQSHESSFRPRPGTR